MRNFSQKIFTDRYATSINMDLADWYLTFAAEERERQAQRKEMKKEFQADVLEMGDTPLLCCPEDHRCKRSCKADKTLCRLCELPVCFECQLCLQRKQLSPMGLMNDNFIGFLDPWVYETDITWMEKRSPVPSGRA